nr:thioredoxin-like protein CITRX, chloroplastic [Malus domestica]
MALASKPTATLPRPYHFISHRLPSIFLSPPRKPTTKNSLFSPSTVKRRLLCSPSHGKHVREDYLVKKASAEEVQELVKGDRNVPIIVDFFATRCGPCILMAQELEMAPGASGDVNLQKRSTWGQ